MNVGVVVQSSLGPGIVVDFKIIHIGRMHPVRGAHFGAISVFVAV